MAKRYYLCDVIGTGTEADPYRPAIADLGPSYTVALKSDPVTGHPLVPWCIVLVASRDHALFRNKAGIDPLPDFSLDGKVSAINAITVAAMKAFMRRRGLPAEAIVDGKDGFREVIRNLGQRLNPDFNEDRFDVRDV